jgi:hypothetical protein
MMLDNRSPRALRNFDRMVARAIVHHHNMIYIWLHGEHQATDKALLIVRWYQRNDWPGRMMDLPIGWLGCIIGRCSKTVHMAPQDYGNNFKNPMLVASDHVVIR